MRVSPRLLAAGLVFAVLLLSFPLATSAQAIPGRSYRKKHAPAKVEPKFTEGKGRVEAVAGGVLKITLRKKTWFVKPGPQCEIEVVGNAEAGYLQQGALVRFNAEVDKTGVVAEPLDEIEVIVLRDGESMGTFSNSLDAPPGTRAVPKGDEPMSLQVVGRMTKLKDGKAFVATGRLNVQIELKPETTINLNTTDYSLAAEGDVIEVKGSYLESGAMLAEEIAITLGKPVSGVKKQAAGRAPKDGHPSPAANTEAKKA